MATALATGTIQPVFLAALSFKTSVQWMWSGVGNLNWSSQTFIGVGSFAKIGTITEATDVRAYGTVVTLSGIDPVLLGDCLSEVVPGAQATLWFGLMANGTIIGSPYQIFNGAIDQPSISAGADTITIDLALESKMVDLARATNRRYTSADQRHDHPTDVAFGWVEQLNDIALIWG
jgi:hypothetical protein